MNKLRGFKAVITLVLKLKKKNKKNEDEPKYSSFYSNTKVETIFHNRDIHSILESIYDTIMTKVQKYQVKGSGWTMYSVREQNISISKYKSLSSSSYIKLAIKLNHSIKDLINIHMTGNSKCQKSYLVRYSHPVDNNLSRIRKTDKTLEENPILKT